MPRALISVSDKRGVTTFARDLVDLGWEIISTGGTAHVISQADVPVTSIEDVTGFPEIMNGRVKTLHPAVHAALLARRDVDTHMDELGSHGFQPIDLVAVNLYPFRETIGRPDVKFADAIEQIDIGGPTMLRSAAKNHEAVIVLVNPSDYEPVLRALRNSGVDTEFRRELAAKVFAHTAAYDAVIAQYIAREEEGLPATMSFVMERLQPLRYGENPVQRAALYSTGEGRGFDDMSQLHGKELSFNNLLDIEAASSAVAPWPDRPACAVIKHTSPCGIALGVTPRDAFQRALSTDPTSAFGSVVAFNTIVDTETAEAMAELFVEVVVAPRFHDEALTVFKNKKNLRIIELPLPDSRPAFDVKRLRGGLLVQDRFTPSADESDWKVATDREPTYNEWRDLRFGWAAVASVKSNAILLARDEAAIGIGAGQMSRVDASFLAVYKAKTEGHDTRGSVLASDAFFPFPDGIAQAAEAGITAVIQPGGSIRDDEVLAEANKHGMAMIMTGQRQFRH
ncbi:MAG: bifunctional phosphoribosylaminoimidazolecarboxamide formyltransferase/IMP cyclohydrolase [Gemmatimonadales bacterium]